VYESLCVIVRFVYFVSYIHFVRLMFCCYNVVSVRSYYVLVYVLVFVFLVVILIIVVLLHCCYFHDML